MSEEKNQGVPQLYPIEKVEESWWNMNTMGPEEYQALGEDMKARGPDGIDPVIGARKSRLVERGVEVPGDIIVCVDGNHRLRKARELKWKEIRLVIAEDIKDEAAARSISYRKNRERGSIDPFKEALNFKWLKEQGRTQEEIAKEYNIDKSQVSKRLSLLRVEPEVVEQIAKVTRVKSASHLEPIATLRPDLQEKVIKEIKKETQYRGDEVDKGQSLVSVREVEDIVDTVKEEDEKRRAFQSAVDKSKHKECPECKGRATKASYHGLPLVMCAKNHTWNLKTGKTYKEEWEKETERNLREAGKEAKPVKEPFPNYILTTYTPAQFKQALSNLVIGELEGLGYVEWIEVEGRTKAGKRVSITLSQYGDKSMSLELEKAGDFAGKIIQVNPFSSGEKDQKDFKTKIELSPSITNKKKAKEAKRIISSLMDKFGEKVKRRKRRKTTKRSKRGKK